MQENRKMAISTPMTEKNILQKLRRAEEKIDSREICMKIPENWVAFLLYTRGVAINSSDTNPRKFLRIGVTLFGERLGESQVVRAREKQAIPSQQK